MKKDLNELSRTGILSRYISKARTQANSPETSTRTALKRERGIDLARKKKWGGIENMPGKPAKVVGTSMKKESVSMKSFNQFIVEAATKVHPNAIHVSDAGAGKYKVHAVGSEHTDRIKVGEHLTDTELDDFSEMGGKIKNVKAKD
jgi:hypothetical protein